MKYGGDGSLIGRLHDAADDGRVAAHQAVGRDGFDNDGVGADDAPAADAHARQNRCFVADPYVVFDDNGAFGGEGALAGDDACVRSAGWAVRVVGNGDPPAGQDAVADADARE